MPTAWGFRADQGRMPVFHFDATSSAASSRAVAWPAWPAGVTGRGLQTGAGREGREETERDRKFKQKVMEGIMAELRREVERLDEDAWMFKKLPF
mmetsp:Transcript_9340/g.17247  ORF Transcript_9340/g.17247 Transcript_9340/m.17247 type:complete len:95 (+) Transcript_9340:109-393(+)